MSNILKPSELKTTNDEYICIYNLYLAYNKNKRDVKELIYNNLFNIENKNITLDQLDFISLYDKFYLDINLKLPNNNIQFPLENEEILNKIIHNYLNIFNTSYVKKLDYFKIILNSFILNLNDISLIIYPYNNINYNLLSYDYNNADCSICFEKITDTYIFTISYCCYSKTCLKCYYANKFKCSICNNNTFYATSIQNKFYDYTYSECLFWTTNKHLNPKTYRKIKENSAIYKSIEKYSKLYNLI